MRCALALELLSARLDGELTPDEVAMVDLHVAGCEGCTAAVARFERLAPLVAGARAASVPDLTTSVLIARRVRTPRRTAARQGARVTLLVAAVLQVGLSAPLLLVEGHALGGAHQSRELGAFNVAFAMGLLVVVFRPERAGGLLPMAAALAAAMLVVGVADIASGDAAPLGEASHLLVLVGLVALRSASGAIPPARRDLRFA